MSFNKLMALVVMLQLTSFGMVLAEQPSASVDNQLISLSTNDLTVLVNEHQPVDLYVRANTVTLPTNLSFVVNHVGHVLIDPQTILLTPNNQSIRYSINIEGVNRGHYEITSSTIPADSIDTSNIFVRVIVAYSYTLIKLSATVGWCYFVAWTISFWPQLIKNFYRKSVIGLSFDFISLNVVGHSLYMIFNLSLYFSSFIETEYMLRHPRGLNPVKLNDVFFSVHATIATILLVAQCFIYERGEQRVSTTAKTILAVFFICITVFASLAIFDKIHWLDFLFYCSYIKLLITLMKYVPQAILNFKRKSTDGWSIENVLLDFTGGMLSMLQMIIDGYNYDDFDSIFGDPTKFGLGLFSVMFDTVFIVQHYVLYRNAVPYNEIAGDVIDENYVESNAEPT